MRQFDILSENDPHLKSPATRGVSNSFLNRRSERPISARWIGPVSGSMSAGRSVNPPPSAEPQTGPVQVADPVQAHMQPVHSSRLRNHFAFRASNKI